MNSGALRGALFLVLLVVVAAAAWQYHLVEQEREASTSEAQELSRFREDAQRSIARARTAQQAYVSPGQGVAFWRTEFAEALAEITGSIENLRANAVERPDATTPLEAADRALRVYEGLDKKIRGFVDAGNSLMAADVVYEDAIKTSGVIAASVNDAYQALVQPHEAAVDDAHRRQQMLAAGAVLAGVLVALLLTPIGRAATPEPLPAPAEAGDDDLHLVPSDRDARPMAAPQPVAHVPTRRPPLVDGIEDAAALDAAAAVCTALGRVRDGDELREALGRAARVLDASGVIVWIADASGRSLKPLLTYGYPDEALRRIPMLPRDADNATAAAWRDATVQVVDATDSAPGAIAVPLLVPEGCTGVLAAEIGHGREASAYTRAVAQILAAQLAVLIPAETSAEPPAVPPVVQPPVEQG